MTPAKPVSKKAFKRKAILVPTFRDGPLPRSDESSIEQTDAGTPAAAESSRPTSLKEADPFLYFSLAPGRLDRIRRASGPAHEDEGGTPGAERRSRFSSEVHLLNDGLFRELLEGMIGED